MDWIRDHLWESWLALSIVLGVAEMFSLDLILAMLAVGALVGMVVAVAGLSLPFQVIAALATSVAMLALVRPGIVRRVHGGPDLPMGHAKLVGTQGVVTSPISGLAPGRIHAGGETWSALPYDEGITIAEGETVEIFEIRGATAYVHPVARRLDP